MCEKSALGNVENFITGIGKVLVKVKDAMVQDILKDIADDNMTWEDFKAKCESDPTGSLSLFKEFVDRIIKKLGFDISSAKSTQELYDLIQSLVVSAKELEVAVSSLVQDANQVDWANLIDTYTNEDSNSTNAVSKQLFGDKNSEVTLSFAGKNASATVSIEGVDRILALIDMVQNIVTLIKKLSSFEWKAIADDAEEFGKFIKESYFTEQFGKRILDYILLLLFKNAKEVFSDDVHALISNIGEIAEKDAEELFKAGSEDLKKLQYYQKQIEDTKKEINESWEEARALALEQNILPDYKVPAYLQAKLDTAQARFDKLSAESVKGFSSVARVFKQVYTILDLMGLVEKKRVNLMKFIPNLPLDIDTKLFQRVKPVEITTLRWDLLTTIFTDPLAYLKNVFHISSAEDVEKLIGKIMEVVKAFNEDNFQFVSVKQLLYTLALRIRGNIAENLGDKDNLNKFEQFILDVLAMQDMQSVKFKELITKQFELYFEGGDNLLQSLSSDVADTLNAIDFSEAGEYITDDGIKFVNFSNGSSDYVKKALTSSVIPVFAKYIENYLVQNYELERENACRVVENLLLDNDNALTNELGNVLKNISAAISDTMTGYWEDNFFDVVNKLNTTLSFDLRDIPNSVSDVVKELGKFSAFDLDDYFKTLSDKFTSNIPFNLDAYYGDIEGALCSALKTVVSGLSVNLDQAGVEALAEDVLSCNWNECKDAVYGLVAMPFKQTVDIAVRKLKDNFMSGVSLDDVASTMESLFDLENLEALKQLFRLLTTVGDVLSIKDGLKFAVELFKLIPEKLKNSLKGFVDLPSLDSIALPAYTLDTKNKYLAVELFNFEKDGNMFNFQLFAYVCDRKIDDKDKTGLFLMPVVKGSVKAQTKLGENHQLTVTAGLDANGDNDNKNFDGKFGFFFYQKDKFYEIVVKPEAMVENSLLGNLSANLEVEFSRLKEQKLEIFKTDIAELSVDDYPITAFLSYNDKEEKTVTVPGFDVGVSGALKNLSLILKLKNQNEFFNKILKKDIQITLENLSIGYTLKQGFNLGGSFFVSIPLASDIEYKGVKFSNLLVEIGGRDGDFVARVCTSFTATINGFSIAFSDMGIGCTCNVLDSKGRLGDFNFSPEYKFPNGLALAIDTSCVKGAGVISWDKEAGRFFGGGEIDILEKFSISAFFLFTTSPFSFMGALYTTFNPGIPLGMGFSITGLGGSLGINRGLDVDKLREAVYDGSLTSVLFVKNLADNLDKVLANIYDYYPMVEDRYFFGFMAQITWGEIVKVDAGLFIQALPLEIIIAGNLEIKLNESLEDLICIKVCFMGGINISKGIFFDASIYDSYLVGMELHGDMALRIYWGGDAKGFILSVGGFHPQYTPEKGYDLPDMKRMYLGLKHKYLELSLEAYFAVTSNTVQFGARFYMRVGLDCCNLTGELEFNALFQFKPFMFTIDMKASLSVKVGKSTLFSISLSFELSGPAKWRAKGCASFHLLFIKISVDFNFSWGKSQENSNHTYIELQPLFSKEFVADRNWKTISSDSEDNQVAVAALPAGIMAIMPADTIVFRQETIPLNRDLECYGEDEISDYNRFDIESIMVGDTPLFNESEELTELNGQERSTYRCESSSFAPSQTKKMKEREKLKAQSFVDMDGGFSLGAGFGLKNGSDVKNISYEVKPSFDKQSTEYAMSNTDEWAALYDSLQPCVKKEEKEAEQTVAEKRKLRVVERNKLTRNFVSERFAARFSKAKRKKRADIYFNNIVGNEEGKTVTTATESSNLLKGLNESYITRKASSRRSSAGFSRFVKALDEKIINNMNSNLSTK